MVCSSSQSIAQKSMPSWAHRLIKRSGKGPVSRTTTIPRIRFISFLIQSPYASEIWVIVPVMSSSTPVMARSSSSRPAILMRYMPPLM